MPIQISTFKTKKEINPKYFTQTFTGDGNRKSGLLSPYRKVFMEGIFEGRKYEMNKKTKSNSNGVSREEIVLDPILYNQYLNIEYIDLEKLMKIEKLKRIEDSSKTNDAISMSVSVLNTDYTKTPSENKDKKVSLNTIYKIAFFRKTDKNQIKMLSFDKEKRAYPFFFDGSPTFLNSHYNNYLKRIENLKENTGIFYFTNNPKAMIDALENNYKTDFDFEKIENYLSPLTDYDLFLKAAYKWNDDLKDYLDFYLNASIRKNDNSFYNNFPIMDFIELLETYNIDLEVYQKVYEILEDRVPNMVKDLSKLNQNLLLCDTLIDIKKNRNLLPKINDVSKNFDKENFSMAQLDAITTTSPLVMISAGAGCGKTKTIEGRIKYLIKSGINPEDITVLSFSNAAADNVKERQSAVKSMTIAKMIHTIYSENFKSHQIATLETFINMIKIQKSFKNVDDMTVETFISYLYKILNNKDNGFMKMNSLIEDKYDEIIEILNTLKLTTLELEIMIAYQKIDTLKVPDSVKTKHIIIDEVQDNSIFEFAYALKYIKEFKSSLYLMGDASQTLFEFRASDPKAINALQNSGVFDTFKLETNYRSNQEILDFANSLLTNIEANQYANVSLKANDMKEVKLDTFKEKVKINHVQVKGLKEFPENIDSYISHSMKDFIDEKLEKGEKIAILSYTRYEVRKFEEAIRNKYKDKEIQNICPKRARDSTIISNYIKEYKEDLKFLDKKKYAKAILNAICAKIPKIMPRSSDLSKKMAAHFIGKWYKQNTQSAQRYANYYLKGQITIDELIEKTSKNLINFEVKNNVIQQSLIAKKNNDEKKIDMDKTDIILSTIHSAKGLEFDNVIVVFKQPSKDLTEADKRMYYVALTRAQKSEYILSYATEDSSLIKDNYDVIIKQLEEK